MEKESFKDINKFYGFDVKMEVNTFYIRDLVSFIRQLDTKDYSNERKLAEIDKFTESLENENILTRSDAREILYNYTTHLLKFPF